mmetsp:Transcript_19886/g.76246  ORF Transcript_19886/g.76246 Transcript_19886/m.76246 type:complete len:301 (-) Transcript_19886:1059-1961(-)
MQPRSPPRVSLALGRPSEQRRHVRPAPLVRRHRERVEEFAGHLRHCRLHGRPHEPQPLQRSPDHRGEPLGVLRGLSWHQQPRLLRRHEHVEVTCGGGDGGRRRAGPAGGERGRHAAQLLLNPAQQLLVLGRQPGLPGVGQLACWKQRAAGEPREEVPNAPHDVLVPPGTKVLRVKVAVRAQPAPGGQVPAHSGHRRQPLRAVRKHGGGAADQSLRAHHVAQALAHLALPGREVPVHNHALGQRQPRGEQECRPVDAVKPHDVLADNVGRGRPRKGRPGPGRQRGRARPGGVGGQRGQLRW